MAKKCCYDNYLMIFFGGREDEDKRMVKLDFFLFSFFGDFSPKTTLFGHTFKNKKTQHIQFWVHGHFSWSTSGSHL